MQNVPHEDVKVNAIRGFYRLQITEGDGDEPEKIVGESGWLENVVVNEGYDDFLCRLLIAAANSKQLSYVALGTGTAPNVTNTQLPGEVMSSTQRKTFSTSVSGSKTVRLTQTFYSSDSFLTAAVTLQNVGLYDVSTAGALFAGNTYTTSSCNTNQNVNVTSTGVIWRQLHIANLVNSGNPLPFIRRGNPERSPSRERAETIIEASLWDDGIVQTTNITVH